MPKNKLTIGLQLIFAAMLLTGAILIGLAWVKPQTPIQIAPEAKVPAKQSALAAKTAQAPGPNLLEIPSLKIKAPFEFLGLNADLTIEVPKSPMSVGCYIYGAKPGETGPLVIVGHLDSAQGRAVFADLDKIKQDD